MFGRRRIKRVHAKFLESCRNLQEGRAYWAQSGGFRRWILDTLSPIPLIGLHENGRRLLEALQWLEMNRKSSMLREETLRRFHRMIQGEESPDAGAYRKRDIAVAGSKLSRPAAQKVPALMKQLDLKLEEEQARLDSVAKPDETGVLTLAVAVHQRIAFIHPFPDANGRVARLAMTHLLRRYGLGYSIFPPVNESADHWNALEAGHRGDLKPLVEFARSVMLRV